MSNSAHNGVWKLATVTSVVVLIGAIACILSQHRSVSSLSAQVTEAAAESANLKAQLAAAQAKATDLQQEFAKSQQQAIGQQQQLQDTQVRLAAESRPDLPVRISFRRALLGQGEVGTFQNLSDRVLEITLDVISPATGASMHRSYVLNPRGMIQVGPLERWPFAPGQKIELTNPGFRPVIRTVQG
jgi:Zn finger protein HypA/HybF involved in hydrogenase expression